MPPPSVSAMRGAAAAPARGRAAAAAPRTGPPQARQRSASASGRRGATPRRGGPQAGARGGDGSGAAKDDGGGGGVSVFVRMRPPREGETTQGDAMRALRILPDNRTVFLKDRFVEERPMEFTQAFGPTVPQEEVFQRVGVPAVQAALSGRNGTVLVYGQTGTGKTYTAFSTDPGKEGLAMRCLRRIFAAAAADQLTEFRLGVQYVQIYNDVVSDLLIPPDRQTPEGLTVREDQDQGTYISGARHTVVNTTGEAFELFNQGNTHRAVRLTTLNAQSSRSHALFIVTVRRTKKFGPSGEAATGEVCGKLTLVDLAGSERIKRTRATGMQRSEAQSINRSLASLGNVIHALADPAARHVPYRDSKLTRLLQDSLGEYGSASIIITFSPALVDVPETLTALQFGQRALCVKQQHKGPRLQVDLKALARQLQQRVRALTLVEGELTAKVSRLEEENQRVRATVDGDEELIDEMHAHIKQCAAKIEQLEGALAERTAERDALQQQVAELSGRNPSRTPSGAQKETEEERQVQQESALRAAWEEERAHTLLCHAAEMAKLRAAIERLESEAAEREERLVAQRERAAGERDALNEENARLREQLEELAEKLGRQQQAPLDRCESDGGRTPGASEGTPQACTPPAAAPSADWGVVSPSNAAAAAAARGLGSICSSSSGAGSRPPSPESGADGAGAEAAPAPGPPAPPAGPPAAAATGPAEQRAAGGGESRSSSAGMTDSTAGVADGARVPRSAAQGRSPPPCAAELPPEYPPPPSPRPSSGPAPPSPAPQWQCMPLPPPPSARQRSASSSIADADSFGDSPRRQGLLLPAPARAAGSLLGPPASGGPRGGFAGASQLGPGAGGSARSAPEASALGPAPGMGYAPPARRAALPGARTPMVE
eukprot:TRINITY_DN5655_c2_g1_i2.p1 TRINITY_DN5655_c2_g1~~TRINITY_DN5655_c2_g1_i2.p1  ORF type:complete len:918 (+),score=278.74 TRINITY_DN5655_c2_g1_i2:81-2756(+)